MEVRSRNALVASPGYELAVFDIAQADIRVLASAVENFPVSAKKHLANLRKAARPDWARWSNSCARAWRNTGTRPSGPRLGQACWWRRALPAAEGLRARRGLPHPRRLLRQGRRTDPWPSPPRQGGGNWFKPIILAIVNGKGANSLAKDLNCSVEEAKRTWTSSTPPTPRSPPTRR